MCACSKRTGAAASGDVSPTGRSRRSDSRAAAPVLFTHATVTVAKNLWFLHPYLSVLLVCLLCSVLWLPAEFFDRFIIIAQPRIVVPSTPREEIDFKPLCEQLLHGVRSNEVFAGTDLGAIVQFGTSRIFLKADAIRGLEVRYFEPCCCLYGNSSVICALIVVLSVFLHLYACVACVVVVFT